MTICLYMFAQRLILTWHLRLWLKQCNGFKGVYQEHQTPCNVYQYMTLPMQCMTCLDLYYGSVQGAYKFSRPSCFVGGVCPESSVLLQLHIIGLYKMSVMVWMNTWRLSAYCLSGNCLCQFSFIQIIYHRPPNLSITQLTNEISVLTKRMWLSIGDHRNNIKRN